MPIKTARLALKADPNTVFGAEAANSPLLGLLKATGPRQSGNTSFGNFLDGAADWVRNNLTGSRTASGDMLVVNFPYTPRITTGVEALYTEMELTHTNYQPHAFNRSQIQNIRVSAKFTAHTDLFAKQALATIHFLRTVTKMRYGEGDPLRGAPPPVLNFSAYGRYMFENVPVVVKSFSINLPDDVDYVEVNVSGFNLGSEYQAIPAVFDIDMELMVQRAVGPVRSEFTLGKFAAGQLSGGSKGYI